MWADGQGRAMPRRRDLPERDFQDFTERVYLQKRDLINDEIAQLEKGTHPKYIDEIAQLKKENERVLRENEIYRQLEVADIEEELQNTIKRADDEYSENVQKLETSMKAELEAYRKELIEEHREDVDPKTAIMRDLDTTRSDRSNAERKRRQVFDEDGSAGPADTRRRGKRSGRGFRGVRASVVRDTSAALRLPIEPQKLGSSSERLASWEIEQDIRTIDKSLSARGRNSRPPAKLKDSHM
eukprot:m.444149 g.444149  ORF g.444149 m.444149 type:complete len:241 (+) comp19055_c0_seq1:135-857(+)